MVNFLAGFMLGIFLALIGVAGYSVVRGDVKTHVDSWREGDDKTFGGNMKS
jgi:hypothetical protein